MDALIFLVSWIAIAIAIVTLNNKVKKEKGENTFYDDTAMGNINKYDYINRHSYRKY